MKRGKNELASLGTKHERLLSIPEKKKKTLLKIQRGNPLYTNLEKWLTKSLK